MPSLRSRPDRGRGVVWEVGCHLRQASSPPRRESPMTAAPMRLLLAVALLVPGAAAGPPASGGGGPPRPKPVRVDRHGDLLPRGALLRLGTVRCRHAGRVTFVGFASGGRILLSAGQD